MTDCKTLFNDLFSSALKVLSFSGDMDRKTFIKTCFTGLGAALVFGCIPFNRKNSGIRIYGDFYPTTSDLIDLIKKISKYGGDYAELFFEDFRDRTLKNGLDSQVGFTGNNHWSCAMRRMSKDEYILKSSSKFRLRSLLQTAEKLKQPLANQTSQSIKYQLPPPVPQRIRGSITSIQELDQMKLDTCRKLLNDIESSIYRASNLIRSADVSYFDRFRRILILNSQGLFRVDYQPLIELRANVIAENKGVTNRISHHYIQKGGLEILEQFDLHAWASRAAEKAAHGLGHPSSISSIPHLIAYRGSLAPLLIELVCSQFTGNTVIQRKSLFSRNFNRKIAPNYLSLADNGAFPQGPGSMNIDDEGHDTQRTLIIEKGIMKAILTDRKTAIQLNLPLTGNARRPSWDQPPLSLPTNCYILPGDYPSQVLVEESSEALLCRSIKDIILDIPRDRFYFTVHEGNRIQYGRVRSPIQNIQISGSITRFFHSIKKVGDDLGFQSGWFRQFPTLAYSGGHPTLKISSVSMNIQHTIK